MGRLCERPGCSDLAAMAYGFDVDRLLVWLSPRDPEGDPLRAGSLCKRHADAMVVPRGWTLDDRREATPRLFRTEPSAGGSPRAPRSKVKATPPEPAEQLSLGSVPAVDDVAAREADEQARTVAEVTGAPLADDDPDATVAIPWLTTFDEQDDLDGVLAARTPLLARAFRGTDRPR